MNKLVSIILTTIERPTLLQKCLNSVITNWPTSVRCILLIGNQNDYDSESYSVISKIIENNPEKDIRHYDLEYDCGISQARNELIHKSLLHNADYILLSADSILFNESMKDIDNLLPCLQKSDRPEWSYYDLIGLQLNNRIEWEAKLNLIPNQSFELDFIEKNSKEGVWIVGDKVFNVWDCDIARNFWIARTESLLKVPYDEQLVACEHEDFFWRAKQEGLTVGCTNLCSGTYNKIENTPEYDKIRTTNFRIGQQRLKDKYSLKGWVSYKHMERIKP